MKVPYALRFREVQDIRQQRCMKVWTMDDTYQALAKREDPVSFLGPSASNITIRERRTTKRISKGAL